jgi:hypothetical protein
VPTLVLHRTGDRCLKVEEGRYLAARIPNASYVELPGIDHLPFVGDQDALLSAIETFLAQRQARAAPTAALATMVAVASKASAADRDLLRRVFDRECQFFRGRPLAGDSDALVASFDGPGRAVQCAASVVSIARQSRIDARAGVHIGEFNAAQFDPPLQSAATAIAAAAATHEVNVSRAVIDLLAGTGFAFAERGRVVFGNGRPVAVSSVQNLQPIGETGEGRGPDSPRR